MKEILNYNGNKITFELGNGDVMVNLTEMAKAFPKKNLTSIINSKEIKDYIEKYSVLKKFRTADLLIVRQGGNPEDQGTWGHQRIALRVAQKLSTEFAILVDEKIEELLTKGYTSINHQPSTAADMFMLQARINLDYEKRISNVESKLDIIIQKQADNENELKSLPVVTDQIPELPIRDKIRMLVNRYCMATGSLQQNVWDNIYQTMYYNYHVSIKACKKLKQSETWLDVAERKGCLNYMYIIISNLLREKGLVA